MLLMYLIQVQASITIRSITWTRISLLSSVSGYMITVIGGAINHMHTQMLHADRSPKLPLNSLTPALNDAAYAPYT